MAIPFLSDADFGSAARVTNLLDPSAAQDAATKAYVDAAIEGLAWKDSCRVATQSNLTIASPGATIDGITMVAGDRVLVKAQSTGSENGIYAFVAGASPMTRTLDMNTAAEVEQATTLVEEGTNAGTSWRQTAVNVTLGSTTLTFTQFGASVSQATETSMGIAELATQAETNTGTDDLRIVTPLKLANYTGFTKKFSGTFGDGSATQYDITHNLNTNDVHIEVYRISDGVKVNCDQRRQSVNIVRLNFAVAPATNTLRCVVVA